MSKFWQKKYTSKYTGAEIDAAVAKADTVPAVTVEDAGSALVVDEEGKIVAGEVSGGVTAVDFPEFPGSTAIGILTFINSATTSFKSKAFDVSEARDDYAEIFGGFDQGEIFTVNYPHAELYSSLGILASKNPDDNSFIVSSPVTWADTNHVIYKLDIDLYVDLNSATLTFGIVKSTVAT